MLGTRLDAFCARDRGGRGSGSRRPVTRKITGIETIQRLLAKTGDAQSTLGRLSSDLLPHRGRGGRVQAETMRRVLRGLMRTEFVMSPRKRAPKSHR